MTPHYFTQPTNRAVSLWQNLYKNILLVITNCACSNTKNLAEKPLSLDMNVVKYYGMQASPPPPKQDPKKSKTSFNYCTSKFYAEI